MGLGFYKFVEYKEGQTVTLVANENYWQGTPGIPNVIFKVTSNATEMQEIISGQIDIQDINVSIENVEQLKAADRKSVV